MIENAIKNGKIDAGESVKRSAPKRKDKEVNNTSLYRTSYLKPVMMAQPKAMKFNYRGTPMQEPSLMSHTERVQFTPIPMTYKELY